MSAARDRLVGFEQTFSAWRRGHPTPRERLDQLQRARAHVATAIEESVRFATNLYGHRGASRHVRELRPLPAEPEDGGRFKVGPAFDQILAGRNRTGARR